MTPPDASTLIGFLKALEFRTLTNRVAAWLDADAGAIEAGAVESVEASPEPAETLKTLFEADLADEEEAIRFYAESARTAAEEGDIGTQRLFENIVLDEEGHKDWLETQLGLIERIGEANYATRHMGMGGDAGAQQ